MTVPSDVRDGLRALVRQRAKEADWDSLLQPRKITLLDAWTTSPDIGGILDRHMPRSKVRAYIKDFLLRSPRGPPAAIPRGLGLREADVQRWFRKPDGAVGRDGRVFTWGSARDWKPTLLSAFERASQDGRRPGPVMLVNAGARLVTPETRTLVESAAKRLGISRLIWR